jgi:hypothetical protein
MRGIENVRARYGELRNTVPTGEGETVCHWNS